MCAILWASEVQKQNGVGGGREMKKRGAQKQNGLVVEGKEKEGSTREKEKKERESKLELKDSGGEISRAGSRDE